MPSIVNTFYYCSTIILYAELLGLIVWLAGIVPTMLLDPVWRASQLLIGFHAIIPTVLYMIREGYENKKALVTEYPLIVLILLLFVIGTDTMHLLGVSFEHHEFFLLSEENGHQKEIYILQLFYACYFSLLNALATTLIAITFLRSPRQATKTRK